MGSGKRFPGRWLRTLLLPHLNWPALALAVLGLGGTVALHTQLRISDSAQVRVRTETEARHIALQLQQGIIQGIGPVRALAQWWTSQGPPLDSEDWRSDSQLFLDPASGLLEARRIDRSGRTRWSVRPGELPVARGEPVPEEFQNWRERARNQSGVLIIGITQDARMFVCSPAWRDGGVVAYVVGIYSIPKLVESVLAGQVPRDYAVTAVAGGRTVYLQQGSAPEAPSSAEIRLPGDVWSLNVALPPSELTRMRSWLLASGLLATVLLYLTARIAHVSHRRAVALAKAYSALRTASSERRRTERMAAGLTRDLERRLADFQTLLEVTPVGIAIAYDRDCRTIWTNRALAKMMGVPEGINISKSGPDAEKLNFRLLRNGVEVDADDLPMQRAARTGQTVEAEELDIVRADGRVVNTMSYAAPVFDEFGEVRGVLDACVDITDHKRAEHQRSVLLEREHQAREAAERALAALRASEATFARLIDSNVIGVVVADPERVLEANDEFLKMTGFTKSDLQARRIRWREMTPPEHRADEEQGVRELRATGRIGPLEREIIGKQGKRVPVMVGGALVENGENWRCISFVFDLTKRRELEQRLQRSEKLKSLALMAGGLAHDFNNLLTVIIGNGTLAHEALPLEMPARNHVGNSLAAAYRAADLVRQLMAYTGQSFQMLKTVDLSSVLREMSADIRRNAPLSAEIRFEIADTVPAIRADAAEMHDVVRHIVANAIEALSGDPGVIEIRTGACRLSPEQIHQQYPDQELAPGDYARLEISDTGCGMNRDVVRRIFDPFFTTKFTGRGLGLSAVQGIVRAHRGAIRVESAEGRGTRVEIVFPGEEQFVEARR